MLKLIIMLSVMGVLLTAMGDNLAAQDFSGSYSVATPSGKLLLTLEQEAGGSVTGTLVMPGSVSFQVDGKVVVDDEDDELSIEGTLTGVQSGGEFILDEPDDEGDYHLLITPYDASGTPLFAQAVSFLVHRAEPEALPDEPAASTGRSTLGGQTAPGSGSVSGSGSVPGIESAPGAGQRDQRLVGIWATQVITNTPEGGIATQIFMEFRSDGTMIDLGNRTMAGIPGVGMDSGSAGGGETAAWNTQGNVLLVSQHGSPWVPLARFEVSGNRLLLTYNEGDRKLWYRQ